MCESFTKQIQMASPGGATSDPSVIGYHAWRLLRSFSFDPKELRGIGIQVQKLEPSSAPVTANSGQALLPFKLVDSSSKKDSVKEKVLDELPAIAVQPPSQEIVEVEQPVPKQAPSDAHLDLPSFSQVDMSVFQELPDDVRRELEAEYKRRSATPDVPQQLPSARAASVPTETKGKITVKGINIKRITRQLAPRSRASISPQKNRLFMNQPAATQLKISETELRKLDLDPAVFAILPVDLQREQLAYARQRSVRGGPGLAFGGEKKVLKSVSRLRPAEGGVVVPPPPPPQAVHPAPPTLKQQGKVKGEKLYFTQTDDVQGVIEAWVDRFREHPPNEKDVQFFARFLVQCVDSSRSTDSGVEKAVAVTKWWLVLLRRHFSAWEHPDENPFLNDSAIRPGTSEYVGQAWWKAFRDVKAQMDVAARKKFGGCLSLK
jgi:DNA repair protein REV1